MKAVLENESLILVPETDLIASKIEELRDFFANELEDHPDAGRIILDVQGIDLVDSLGVNLIVGLYREVTDASKEIEIVGASKNFMKVAGFFRLTSLFPIEQEKAGS